MLKFLTPMLCGVPISAWSPCFPLGSTFATHTDTMFLLPRSFRKSFLTEERGQQELRACGLKKKACRQMWHKTTNEVGTWSLKENFLGLRLSPLFRSYLRHPLSIAQLLILVSCPPADVRGPRPSRPTRGPVQVPLLFALPHASPNWTDP